MGIRFEPNPLVLLKEEIPLGNNWKIAQKPAVDATIALYRYNYTWEEVAYATLVVTMRGTQGYYWSTGIPYGVPKPPFNIPFTAGLEESIQWLKDTKEFLQDKSW